MFRGRVGQSVCKAVPLLSVISSQPVLETVTRWSYSRTEVYCVSYTPLSTNTCGDTCRHAYYILYAMQVVRRKQGRMWTPISDHGTLEKRLRG